MDIQVMATNPQMEGLEGIKFAKFLKRATGSRRMSSALLKTAGAAAVIGGTAYYTNRRFGWWQKFRNRFSKPTPAAKIAAKTSAKKAAKKAAAKAAAKKAAEKGANGWFNAGLFKNLATTFLTPKTEVQVPQAQGAAIQPMQAQGEMKINPLLLAGLAAVGGIMLLKK